MNSLRIMVNMPSYVTDQERFWAGDFGNNYIERNNSKDLLASNINFFSESLRRVNDLKSCIEFGANIGMNIRALKYLYPSVNYNAIEINKNAIEILKETIPIENIFEGSINEFNSIETWDLVIIKGVLIHINPDFLKKTYEKLVKSTKKYLLIAEYYSRNPEALNYRGFSNKLYKRDFAGEILDSYPEIKLEDYGFKYHKDINFPQDDISWFLLKKIK